VLKVEARLGEEPRVLSAKQTFDEALYYRYSTVDGVQANILGRFTSKMRTARKHSKRVVAFQEAQEFWETKFGNWFSKLSQEVRTDEADESEKNEGVVENEGGLVLELGDDLWRSESNA
jgi:CRISPR/Cas system-associated protein Csm6